MNYAEKEAKHLNMKCSAVKRKAPGGRIAVLFFLISLLSVAAAAYFILFQLNEFSLEIELIGDKSLCVEYGEAFQDPGVRVILRGTQFCTDGIEVDSSAAASGSVNVQKIGKYQLHYHCRFLGMEANAERTVRVMDTVCPVITLTPDDPGLQPAPEYQEAGYSAYDNYDGDITDKVLRTPENGKITYSVIDSSGNPTYVEREIPIYTDYPPELTLLGDSRMTIYVGEEFTDPGCTAFDMRDGDLTGSVSVTIDHPFVRYTSDTYRLTYSVTDSDGHTAAAERTVTSIPQERPSVVYPSEKTIYLTFDDGPGPYTDGLLDVLKRYNVKATFFVVDTGYTDIMRRIVNEGHSIGIHTRTHRYQEIYSDAEAYFQDLFQMQQIIEDATGVKTQLLRFPGGSSNTISRKTKGIMTYLTQAVQDCGFAYFDWNVDSNDAGGAKTANEVYRNVISGIGSSKYCVVLQHDIHSFSVDAVESIIQWGLQNGYSFAALQTDSPQIRHAVQN